MINKLVAAIVTVILMRWVTRWTGLDIAELDEDGEVKTAIALLVDACVASVTGLFVWWVPNIKGWLRSQWWWPWGS